MDPYILVLVAAGLLILLVAWLPMLVREMPLSLPIACVAIGYLAFAFVVPDDEPHPLLYPEITERLTEMLVIVALMGCGLKLDRPLARDTWRATWRLLGIVMPLCIAGAFLLGWGMMGLSAGAAILLGAALSPTDPVLASDVQVGPPRSGEEDDVRFSLTSEAGLNDGLAFPFTNLALAVALHSGAATPHRGAGSIGPDGEWILHWIAVDVFWKLFAGLVIGWLIGRVLGYVTFRLPNRSKLSRTGDGFLALALTFISYGLTELAHGYGFLAVFMTAIAFRQAERNHSYHERLHDFAEQIERLFMMVVLVLFGGALAKGLMAPLTWTAAGAGLIFLFLVRPLATFLAFRHLGWSRVETLVVGFFGIRGVGSMYYLAYAFNEATWEGEAATLWAAASFIVLVSIVLHGTTVTPVMRMLDGRRNSRIASAASTTGSGTPGQAIPSAARRLLRAARGRRRPARSP
jgi:NhaP-type Na+/H+ or K+/H+ antiporter